MVFTRNTIYSRFGFGLHTGTFFLIPNILNIYNETTLDGYITTGIKSYVFLKSLPIVISWGIGTAIGELPPILYHAILKKIMTRC